MRVVLAEDGVLLREGLTRLLGEAGFKVVGQRTTADDLLLKGCRALAETRHTPVMG